MNRLPRPHMPNSDVQTAAYVTVKRMLDDGKLERQPCEICGAEPTHAHHDSYHKPDEVRWLCRSHHFKWHAEHGPAPGRLGPRARDAVVAARKARKRMEAALMKESGCQWYTVQRWLSGDRTMWKRAQDALTQACKKLKIANPRAQEVTS